MGLYAFTANFSSAILSSALPELATALVPLGSTHAISFSTLAQLIAVNNLMLGVANIWWIPLSNSFGRRPIILVCLAILATCSVWCGQAKSFDSMMAARVIQGM